MSVNIVDKKIIVEVTTDDGAKKSMVLSDNQVKIITSLIYEKASVLENKFSDLEDKYQDALYDYKKHFDVEIEPYKNEWGEVSYTYSGVKADPHKGDELRNEKSSRFDDLSDVVDELDELNELYGVADYVIDGAVSDDEILIFLDRLWCCNRFGSYSEQLDELRSFE